MSTAQETVQGIVIDVCTRTFLLLSDQGSERRVECDTVQEFMNVLEVVTAQLNPEQIEYADLAIYGEWCYNINIEKMEVFTVEEFQDRFDELIERVENGERLGIIDEDGKAVVMVRADEELIRIHTELNNEAS